MLLVRQRVFVAAAIFFALIAAAGSAVAGDLSSVSVGAASLVPCQETRYMLKFHVATALDLSKGAALTVEFPHGYNIIQNDSLAADPGCTLTRLEYRNPGDRAYAVVHGTVSVNKSGDGVRCSFMPQPEQLVIPANTDLYLVVPGIINPPAAGREGLKLFISDARGAVYQGGGVFSLGLPPAAVPRHVRLREALSNKVQLAWDPVPGATRYRVLFSAQPDGQFISALDFTGEPVPGEEWQLTETTHSFSGRGNGGLSPGKTYYFKVQAGNAYGFGPDSAVLRVVLPEIRPVSIRVQGGKGAAAVLEGKTIAVSVNQAARIVNEDRIRVYEKTSGVRVKQVQTIVDERDNRIIRINAALQPGREYLAVFYEGALESRGQPGVFNHTFSRFIAVPGGN